MATNNTSGFIGGSSASSYSSSTTGAASKTKSSPQNSDTSNNLTTDASDIYPAYQPKDHAIKFNYDFDNMLQEQMGKQKNSLLRFSLVCNGYKFQAHIDPTHITNDQSKRIVQLDTLTGIVLQDFGYAAQHIEIRGSTGAAYYVEIEKLDTVFSNQSTGGNPTICTLILEGKTYSGVWRDFSFERQAQDNIYKYVIGFTVMKKGKYQDNSMSPSNFNSNQTAANAAANSASSSTSTSKVSYIDTKGKSPSDYLRGITSKVPAGNRSVALAFFRNNWATASQNSKRGYPGDGQKLNKGEVLVVPTDWSTVVSSSTTGGNW